MKTLRLISLMLVVLPRVLLAGDMPDTPELKTLRQDMVDRQIRQRGISDPAVLTAMNAIPRHCFVPARLTKQAYADRPLPIGAGQTISQPYIVALMTARLNLQASMRILEIGTGSGYQAAVLANIVKSVYTIEIKEPLYKTAKTRLTDLGINNIRMRHGDGYFGWPAAAPFDCIMITASVNHIPPPLLQQLKDGGRLILPLGNPFAFQNLVLVTRHGQDYTVKNITGVLFVPMTGHALSGDALR